MPRLCARGAFHLHRPARHPRGRRPCRRAQVAALSDLVAKSMRFGVLRSIPIRMHLIAARFDEANRTIDAHVDRCGHARGLISALPRPFSFIVFARCPPDRVSVTCAVVCGGRGRRDAWLAIARDLSYIAGVMGAFPRVVSGAM